MIGNAVIAMVMVSEIGYSCIRDLLRDVVLVVAADFDDMSVALVG